MSLGFTWPSAGGQMWEPGASGRAQTRTDTCRRFTHAVAAALGMQGSLAPYGLRDPSDDNVPRPFGKMDSLLLSTQKRLQFAALVLQSRALALQNITRSA